MAKSKIPSPVRKDLPDLLAIAFWWYKAPRHMAPKWVQAHPFWPANNKGFHEQTCLTADPEGDRLWEAIHATFGITEWPH
jgi:hypothetical protein